MDFRSLLIFCILTFFLFDSHDCQKRAKVSYALNVAIIITKYTNAYFHLTGVIETTTQ